MVLYKWLRPDYLRDYTQAYPNLEIVTGDASPCPVINDIPVDENQKQNFLSYGPIFVGDLPDPLLPSKEKSVYSFLGRFINCFV